MGFGIKAWEPWVIEGQEAIDVIKAAYAAGINTFYTADIYSTGNSEILLGKALKEIGEPRDSFVVMTKVFFPHEGPDKTHRRIYEQGLNPDQHGLVNRYGLSRKHIFTSIKESLKRLDLEYVDVLQCHRFDLSTPIEETMKALHDVVQAGLMMSLDYAINNNLTPFISMQNHQSLIYREEEREMNPTCKMLVSTKSSRDENDPWISMMKGKFEESSNEIIGRVEKVANDKGISMAQVAVAWVLHQDVVAAPIVGVQKVDRLEDLIGTCIIFILAHQCAYELAILGAIDVKLTPEEMKYLEEPYIPRTIMGH
ncbi:3870_t:CDS:2 [Acaulospora colombiana]|uniref:3870_t:CDS:1 n=1 Tax=Acaulospora colombiana TaxID=27376 RepID=A0ACA9MEH8_9GLOM|nr:3870_t:CDS:2 [Acaulospora colombiana]